MTRELCVYVSNAYVRLVRVMYPLNEEKSASKKMLYTTLKDR